MKTNTSDGLDPKHDPSRRLLVRVPSQPEFLAVVATACRIYCHALPGGGHLFAEVAQAVNDAATKAGSGTATHVEMEFRITVSRLQVSVAEELLQWEIDASAP